MEKVLLVLGIVALLWVLIMTAIPFVVDGFFYSIDTPVPIRHIFADRISLIFVRFSRISLPATYTNELQCDELYHFGESVGMLEQGQNTFHLSLPLPEDAEGPCQYRGSVTYSPFGFFGPPLSFSWESEVFMPHEN